jgi:hypothetical protein
MWKRWRNSDSITIRRTALWTIGLFPVVLVGLILAFWIHGQIEQWVYWKIGLVLLVALEVAYGVSVSVGIAGTLVLGALILYRGRRGPTAPWLLRGLLLCGSLLLAAMVAEAACAAWRGWAQRSSATSVGFQATEAPAASEVRFPAPVADFSLPTEFPDSPGDRDIDLVVIGESSAEGVPFNRWLSPGHIIAWKLTEVIPGRFIRPIGLALAGSTLESQHKALMNLHRRPEILIIYCGQAELSVRVSASRDRAHYFDELLPGSADVLLQWVERSSPVCGLLHGGREQCRTAIPQPTYGYRKLIDTRAYTLSEYTTVLLDFRRRLGAIVTYAERLGALPILVAPASNDAGYEPNRSFLPANTPRAEREAFEREFLEARQSESSDPDRAIGRYRALLARQPGFAEVHYRMGQLLERKELWEEAFRHYALARDLDGFPTRTLTAFQNAYREVAARHDCILIDLQSYFHLIGRHGLLDDELFQDGMHLSLRGHIALAQAVLQALHRRRAFGWPKDSAVPSIDPTECARVFNLKPAAWKVICYWGIMFGDIAVRWRYDPSERLQRRRLYIEGADRLEAGADPESLGLPNIGVPAPIPVELGAQPGGRRASTSSPGPPARFDSSPPR